MDTRKIMLLVGALVVAAVCTFLARSLLAGSAAQQATAQPVAVMQDLGGPQILVAQRTLPIGSIIKPEDVGFQSWPKDLVQNAYFIEGEAGPSEDAAEDGAAPVGSTIEDAVGKVVRVSISMGQPVSRRAIVGPGESGFLAAALGKGMRAITVPVNNISGVAGFIFPGDRVDLLLTHNVAETGVSDEQTSAAGLKVAETIVRNIRVLAIDQRLDDTDGAPKVGRTVTFEVPPKMVEKITVAQSLGSLSLSLRSLADNRAQIDQAIADGRIEVGDDQSEYDDVAMEFTLRQLPDDSGSTFTTGGEVSRFALDQNGVRRKGASKSGGAVKSGPSVRVTRGTNSKAVSVEKAIAAVADAQSEGMQRLAEAVSAAPIE